MKCFYGDFKKRFLTFCTYLLFLWCLAISNFIFQSVDSVIDLLNNNNAPVFENQNNAAADAYEFKLPMPFPKGVNVNWAFGVDIRALDYDIGNQKISFTINDPEGNFEILEMGASNDPKQRFSLAVRTLKLLDLTAPTSFTITATVGP